MAKSKKSNNVDLDENGVPLILSAPAPSGESPGACRQRHKKEKEALDKFIETYKKANKSNKSHAADQCDSWLSLLAIKHSTELTALGAASASAPAPDEDTLTLLPTAPAPGKRRPKKVHALPDLPTGPSAQEREYEGVWTLLPEGKALHDVPTDGSCFYHAVAATSGYTAGELRATTADELAAHPALYEMICGAEDYNKYIEGVRNREWATFVEIQALAAALGQGIRVYSVVPGVGVCEVPEGQCEIEVAYFTEYNCSSHYMAVI